VGIAPFGGDLIVTSISRQIWSFGAVAEAFSGEVGTGSPQKMR
jgi:hypothetical protein